MSDETRWGPWRLSESGRALERNWENSIWHYWVDLEACDSPAKVLDRICQVAGRYEFDDAAIAGLVRALNDLLDPQANLCSWGKPSKLSRRKLDELLAEGHVRWGTPSRT